MCTSIALQLNEWRISTGKSLSSLPGLQREKLCFCNRLAHNALMLLLALSTLGWMEFGYRAYMYTVYIMMGMQRLWG